MDPSQQPQGWGQQLPPGTGPTAPGAPETPPGAAPFAYAKVSGYAPGQEEKDQAFYAHLFAALANVVFAGTGLHLVGPLVPMFMAKQKPPFLMFHVNQSFWFQVGLYVINVVLGIITAVTCGFAIIITGPLMGIVWLVAVLYPILVGLKVKQGEWAEYAVVGQKILEQKSPVFK